MVVPWPGWLDWSTSNANTNELYLPDPRFSSLATYFGNSKNLYRCPSDIYAAPQQRALGWNSRMRSVSGSIYVGGDPAPKGSNPLGGEVADGPADSYFIVTDKMGQMRNPGPANTFVYLDENADSINDASFFQPWGNKWYDMPANYHNGAAGFAFADGHSEIHKWQDSALAVKVDYSGNSAAWRNTSVASTDRDYVWIREHSSHN